MARWPFWPFLATQLLVYNSENRFVGSFYQFTCRVKRVKRYFEKSVFWDRLVANLPVKSQLPSLFSGSLFVLSVAWTISNKKLLNKTMHCTLTIALAISSQSQSLSTRGNYFARCLIWGKGCYTEKGTESHCVTDPGRPFQCRGGRFLFFLTMRCFPILNDAIFCSMFFNF